MLHGIRFARHLHLRDPKGRGLVFCGHISGLAIRVHGFFVDFACAAFKF